MSARDAVRQTREAARELLRVGSEGRARALRRAADALIANTDEILAANALDRADAARAVAAGTLSAALAARLDLTASKLAGLADGLRQVAAMPEPVGRVLRRTELADGLILRQETVPLGVLLVIFEARPDALPQIFSLALRSGNGLVLKGGSEAARSNVALHRVLTRALAPGRSPRNDV